MRTDYLEAYRGGEGELIEKKSRFIAQVRPVKSEGRGSFVYWKRCGKNTGMPGITAVRFLSVL